MSVEGWVKDRVPTQVVHLDVAGAGRVSVQVLKAQLDHLRAEADVGAYVAEAAVDLTPGRAALASGVGLAEGDVMLHDSAAAAFATLLDAWPLPPGSRLGTVPGEYGGHARVLADRAQHRGWTLVQLPVDPLGRVVHVPTALDLISLPLVASQRGVVQPAADLIAAGVPVLLDVAQGYGQTAIPPGAAAYVGTSRKWLCGPRGVGFAMVDPAWQQALAPAVTLRPFDTQGMAQYDSHEANIAGRVGLAAAARAWSPALLPVLQAAAAAARVLLHSAGGWQVVEPLEEPTGITTLSHPTASPAQVRRALLAEGFVTSVVETHRAADVEQPLLRVSTAAWVTPPDLERLAEALHRLTSR